MLWTSREKSQKEGESIAARSVFAVPRKKLTRDCLELMSISKTLHYHSRIKSFVFIQYFHKFCQTESYLVGEGIQARKGQYLDDTLDYFWALGEWGAQGCFLAKIVREKKIVHILSHSEYVYSVSSLKGLLLQIYKTTFKKTITVYVLKNQLPAVIINQLFHVPSGSIL